MPDRGSIKALKIMGCALYHAVRVINKMLGCPVETLNGWKCVFSRATTREDVRENDYADVDAKSARHLGLLFEVRGEGSGLGSGR